ncbi:hypothetical protein PVA45_02950 [Entomospira entomophila]|uniref:Lipoprotein n=1 Tax=Entomospira entomophila TaxID=2719988 RepID=A0A968G8G0_9SPIO|nr:hypothetical protein [Entomospira entomophilus]NIZ40473.1 hypothetical protein [Entomospira entomophilus]WDI36031.1 hypothetical protein PVA45_02950 [Entomospira entomophilus]
MMFYRMRHIYLLALVLMAFVACERDSTIAMSDEAETIHLSESDKTARAIVKTDDSLDTEQEEQEVLFLESLMTNFGSMQEKLAIDFKEMQRYINETNTPIHNKPQDLLPDWLRVGEKSLAQAFEHLKDLKPTIYISEELQVIKPEEVYLLRRIENPDIARSLSYFIPIPPSDTILYDYDYIEHERLSKLFPINSGYISEYRRSHWHVAYSGNQPIIYEYSATLAGVDGRMQLEFHGDFLQSVIFVPNQKRRIDVSHQALPLPAGITFTQSTLGNIFSEHGFFWHPKNFWSIGKG